MGAGADPGDGASLAHELSSLAIYERHLQAAPTWPYHTGQLRTLVITVLIPIATLVARLLMSRVFEIDL
jgi:hypothetical protein